MLTLVHLPAFEFGWVSKCLITFENSYRYVKCIGILFLSADVVMEEKGELSRQHFMNPKVTLDTAVKYESPLTRIPSPALELALGTEDNRNQKAVAAAHRHRIQEERILSEYSLIVKEINVDDDALKPSRCGITSVVPIKTFLTLLEFHFPLSFSTAVVESIKSIAIPLDITAENLRSPKDSTLTQVQTADSAESEFVIDPMIPVYENPLQLLQSGYIISKRFGRLLEHTYALEYLEFCIQCIQHLQGTEQTTYMFISFFI